MWARMAPLGFYTYACWWHMIVKLTLRHCFYSIQNNLEGNGLTVTQNYE